MLNNLDTWGTASTSGPSRPWHVLQVEDNADDVRLVNRILLPTLPAGSKITHAGSLSEAVARLQQSDFDLVLLDLSLPDSHGMQTLRDLTSQPDSPPVVVMSGCDDPLTACEALKDGASDYVLKTSGLCGDTLHERLRKVVVPAHEPELPDAQQETPALQHDASKFDNIWYPVTLPAVVVPIDDEGGPGQELTATTIEVARNQISLLTELPFGRLPSLAMVGVETVSGDFHYAAFQWIERENCESGLQLKGRLLSRAGDPFHDSKLVPQLDSKTYLFTTEMAETSMQQWAVRGVLKRRKIDRVKTCPQCTGLATFRDGCPKCGNAYTNTTQLIHHFACAHVAPVSEYETDGLVCPKCRERNLVVGADFEYLDGPCRCPECYWSDVCPVLLGECLACGLRFPGSQAHEKDILQFYVSRLDLLALVEERH